MSIYNKVKDACKEKGTTVNALEEKLNFARSSIYKWNVHNPSVDKLMAVAKELNKPIEYFLDDTTRTIQ
ncbi:MAG: helix-turn-helix transcriptional regulator [Lachnospiraceae bacterium]|nr:helix-turn-helix transcriptional regulator [Lachnospiraceae bacterium]MBP3477554.1 helix-turn-helix transcriptional regulator [Lachnospiraceae bacterium]